MLSIALPAATCVHHVQVLSIYRMFMRHTQKTFPPDFRRVANKEIKAQFEKHRWVSPALADPLIKEAHRKLGLFRQISIGHRSIANVMPPLSSEWPW